MKLGYAPEAITPTASFVNDLGFDSLDIADLAMQMELEFDIPIAFDQIENGFKTINDLVQVIEPLLIAETRKADRQG